MKTFVYYLSRFFVAVSLLVPVVSEAAPLNTLEAVRSLSPEQSVRHLPVALDSQVVQVNPINNWFYVRCVCRFR